LIEDLTKVEAICPWEYLTRIFNFERKDGVTGADPEEQRQLLQAYLLSMAFPSLALTKPIVGILGPRGSGKTSASRNILRFWSKPHTDVQALTDDKPDSVRAMLEKRLMLVLDNLEQSVAKWLPQVLNRVSTGSVIELRQLYKTNKLYSFRPYCHQVFSAIELPELLKDEALADRCLPLQLDRLDSPISEAAFQARFYDNYAGIWAGFAAYLNRCVVCLRETENERNIGEAIRLADFANFCRRIRNLPSSIVDADLTKLGLRHLGEHQNRLTPTHPLCAVLEVWLSHAKNGNGGRLILDDPAKPRTAGELFPLLRDCAITNKLPFRWTTHVALGVALSAMQPTMLRDYGLKLGTTQGTQSNKTIPTYAFLP
jgi:hypothetical protein